MAVPIEKFIAGWKPKSNNGRFKLKLSTGQILNLGVDEPVEFSLIYNILTTAEHAAVTDSGYIVTGPEEIE